MTQDPQEPLDQAAAWIARLRADDVTSTDRMAFADWLGADAANTAAFDDMLGLWSDLGVMRVLPLEAPPVALGAATRARPRWHVPAALVACAATLVLLVFPRAVDQAPLQLRTPVGGFDQVRLEDGSEITLNTDTALSVQIGKRARTVTMDRGEAFFSVAADAARPFTAVCGDAAVTVLGTAFGARCDDGEMRVVVERGAVRFGAAAATGPVQILHAGDASRFAARSGLGEVSRADAALALAWQQRQLVFEDVPLAEVIGELQRYLEPTLRVIDPDAAAIRVSGVFDVNEPRLTLGALEQGLGLSVTGPEQGPLLIGIARD